MSDTENTKTTPKEKKPTLSVTYVKLLSFLFNALDGEDSDLKHHIMEKMSAFASVEEQIDFFNNLCSNENWKVLTKEYKTYVKENEKATKADAKKAEKEAAKAAKAEAKKAEKEAAKAAKTAETEENTSEKEATASSSDIVVEEASAPVETSSEEKPKKKGGKKKKSEEKASNEASS
jgi:hypothetical protein